MKCKPWTERFAKKGLSRQVSRGAWKRRINRELEAKMALKPWIFLAKLRSANRELGTFRPPKFQCFSSQCALHGLRALEVENDRILFCYPHSGWSLESLSKFSRTLIFLSLVFCFSLVFPHKRRLTPFVRGKRSHRARNPEKRKVTKKWLWGSTRK